MEFWDGGREVEKRRGRGKQRDRRALKRSRSIIPISYLK